MASVTRRIFWDTTIISFCSTGISWCVCVCDSGWSGEAVVGVLGCVVRGVARGEEGGDGESRVGDVGVRGVQVTVGESGVQYMGKTRHQKT